MEWCHLPRKLRFFPMEMLHFGTLRCGTQFKTTTETLYILRVCEIFPDPDEGHSPVFPLAVRIMVIIALCSAYNQISFRQDKQNKTKA